MRKTVLVIATLVALTTGSAAVVGYDGPKDQPHIMGSGSSASATTAAGPNGTQYRAKVSMVNRSTETGNSIHNISFGKGEKPSISFNGRITAPTPCQVIDHEIEETNGSYKMKIETVENNQDRVCAQVETGIEYRASFETKKSFHLKVMHDGKEIRTIEHPGRVEEPTKPENRGGFRSFVNWFKKLFG